MAVLSALKNMNITQSFEDAFKAKDITSPEMQAAIQTWFNLYFDVESNHTHDPAQRVPYIIVDGLYKSAFGEYEYSLDEAKPNGKPIAAMLANLDKIRSKAFQQACTGGEILLKPVIKRDNFVYSVIPRDNMIVLARDSQGDVTDLITSELTVKSEAGTAVYYRLLERRTLDTDGYCTVQNKLYQSKRLDVLGTLIPLTTLPEYANLQPQFTFTLPLDNLGLIPAKMPMVNCVDGSQDGVSIYAAAAKEILKLYRHETRSQDEYDLTAPHMIASIDLQDRNKDGTLIQIPKYITPLLDDDSSNVGLQIWNPKPNQVEIEARDDQICRKIENIIGLRRGFLSNLDQQEKTATEVLSTTTKMAHLIEDLQGMWNTVLPEAARTCCLLAQMYALPGWVAAEPPEITVGWGDGILYDEEAEFQRLNAMVAQQNLMPEYLVGWYFDMSTDTPEDLAAIREKYMPEQVETEDDAGNDEV